MAKKSRNIRLDSKTKFVIAGGGTGGHLYPALAIAEALKAMNSNVEIIFLGTARGLEAKVIPEMGYPIYLLPMRGLLRRLTWQNVLFPLRYGISILKCMLLFRRFRPDLVIGTGGYVSGPALTAAKWLRIKRVIQEQNSYPGLVNRRHGNQAEAVFLTFAASKKYFKKNKNVFVFGNPVQQKGTQLTKAEILQEFGLSAGHKTLLIFGGSQGAKRLNEIVAEALPGILAFEKIQVIWIAGPKWYEKWLPLGAQFDGRVKILSFIKDMARVYAVTDLAVCRAGATTIAELTYWGIPAIYVPFPYATADHQTTNAKTIVEAGGGILLNERDLQPESLGEIVKQLIGNEERLQIMSSASRSLARPNAAQKIAQKCFEIIQSEQRMID